MLLQSTDGGNPTTILIDGGPSHTYEKNLKPTLDTVLPGKKLDLVILSHIDNDHVLGLLDLFEAIKAGKEYGGSEGLKVSNLWHNSFSIIIGSNSDSRNLMRHLFLSNQFSRIENDFKIAKLPALGALKGISEGRDLIKLAKYLNIPINPQYGGDLIVTNEGRTVVQLKNMKFYILGPTQKSLDRLKKVWDEWEKQHLQAEARIEDFEVLKALDSSISNLSSIMFLVESEGKTILLTGDGLGGDIVESLSKYGLLDSQGKLHVDILKVPHHGSERNVSEQFFETITADVYVISANGRDDNPSFLTLKWIIENGQKCNRKIIIVATNKTENIENILQTYDPINFQFKFVFLEQQKEFLELDEKIKFMLK